MTKECIEPGTLKRPRTGTKEWSEHSKNIFLGCAHDCRYCYARADARRFRRISKDYPWSGMALGVFAVTEKPRKLKGRIMFPTTHDILPSLLPVVVPYLKGWLDAGNEILIVTKPHLDVIQALCDDLFAHRDQILFRFTIGSTDDATLKFWEPGAPGYLERLTSLKFAKLARFKTSVSCEPYLDASIWDLVMDVYPHVTNDIWIGLMNNIVSRVNIEGWSNDDHRFLYVLLGQQHPNAVRYLYNSLRNAPKIRWKDSIRKMLNLPDNSEVIG